MLRLSDQGSGKVPLGLSVRGGYLKLVSAHPLGLDRGIQQQIQQPISSIVKREIFSKYKIMITELLSERIIVISQVGKRVMRMCTLLDTEFGFFYTHLAALEKKGRGSERRNDALDPNLAPAPGDTLPQFPSQSHPNHTS